MQTAAEGSTKAIRQIEQFKRIVGDIWVFVDEENLNKYAHDETENLHFLPDIVIKPRSAEEISAIGDELIDAGPGDCPARQVRHGDLCRQNRIVSVRAPSRTGRPVRIRPGHPHSPLRNRRAG